MTHSPSDPVSTSVSAGRRWFWGIAVLALVVIALGTAGRARRSTSSTSISPPVSTTVAGERLTAGTYRREISVGGRARSYLVHVPDSLPEGPSAVVLVFHGGGGNADNAMRMSHFDVAADRHGFVAVFPNGTGRLRDRLLTFNAGNCCGSALDDRIDDVAFTRALIDDLGRSLPIDRNRLFVTGMSNGGMMSYRLACEAADLFAAAAPVAGANNLESCRPSMPVALLAVHGTADRSVKFEGGPTDAAVRLDIHDRVDRSVDESIRPFLELARCTPSPTVTRSGDAERRVYACAGGAVEVLAVIGGGHAWPGGERGSNLGDPPSRTVDATEAIWAFFATHPRR
ncbi:MAG: polyhydroxybutyrate depolymerase [Dehalococcoidia bacterium]|nr:MAG: polyhydroxybutyrate depolymerase [Dehalococcoidia bacterium]